MKRIIIVIILIGIYSCNENPVKSDEEKNNNPIISSLTVFPKIVNPSDSLIVVCNATEPDGDTLVYDWITSGSIVRIKNSNHHWLYNTKENSQIIYAPDSNFIKQPVDTFWVQCMVRDRKGGQVGKIINFIVK